MSYKARNKQSLSRDQGGKTMIEYAMIVACFSIVAATTIHETQRAVWDEINIKIAQASEPSTTLRINPTPGGDGGSETPTSVRATNPSYGGGTETTTKEYPGPTDGTGNGSGDGNGPCGAGYPNDDTDCDGQPD